MVFVRIAVARSAQSRRTTPPSPKHHHQALTNVLPKSSDVSCTGDPTSFHSPTSPDHKVASLFCEPSKISTTADPSKANSAEEASGQKDLRNDLRRSTSPTNRRGRNTKKNTIPSTLADGSPQPYAESIQAGTGDAKLTPWKPPATSGPPKESDWCGGDGPYYANGNGCIGPGRRARDAGGLYD